MKFYILGLLAAMLLPGCGGDKVVEKKIEAQVDSTILTNWLIQGENTEIWKHMSPRARAVFGSYSDFDEFQQTLMGQLGEKKSGFVHNVFVNDDVRYAETMASYSGLGGAIKGAFLWILNGGGSQNVEGLEFRLVSPEAVAKYPADRQSKTDFRLPFANEMVVLWGGKDTFINYHADTNAQRYAVDFLSFEGGNYFKNDGSENEDHFCWGKPIYAPGSGTVISVDNDIPDNEIPIENDTPSEYLGNHVGIDHGNGEYSILAHLQQYSVEVNLGDQVTAGDYLGECGNSGLSDLPHLHFHIQDSADFLDIVGSHGFPAEFHNIWKNGDQVSRSFIERGDSVAPVN